MILDNPEQSNCHANGELPNVPRLNMGISFI